MANRKTLHICVSAGPYGNETPVSLFRLVEKSLDKGHNVNVLASLLSKLEIENE